MIWDTDRWVIDAGPARIPTPSKAFFDWADWKPQDPPKGLERDWLRPTAAEVAQVIDRMDRRSGKRNRGPKD